MRLKHVVAYLAAGLFAVAALCEIFVINTLEQQEALESAILAGDKDVDVFVGVYRIACEPNKPGYINAWERETDANGGQVWQKPLLTHPIRAVVCDNGDGPKQDSAN